MAGATDEGGRHMPAGSRGSGLAPRDGTYVQRRTRTRRRAGDTEMTLKTKFGWPMALAVLVAVVGITHPQSARGVTGATTATPTADDGSGTVTAPANSGEFDAAARLGRLTRSAQALRRAEVDGRPVAEQEALADEIAEQVVGLGAIEYLFGSPFALSDAERDEFTDEMRSEHSARDAELARRLNAFRQLATALQGARLQGDRAAMRAHARALAETLKDHEVAGGQKPLDPESVRRVVAPRVKRGPAMTPDALNAVLGTAPVAAMADAGEQVVTATASGTSMQVAALATDEAAITPQIQALADSLERSPIRIYNWVHDHIRFTPTYGVLRGADRTLVARQGNAYDTNALLVALLRAAGYQARFVYGTVQVPIDQIQNWVGGARTPDDALELLLTGGIPTRYLTAGGRISALQFEHMWVEAFVDFIPSRGVIERTPDTWVPLDGSFKQYVRSAPLKLREASGVDAKKIVEDFIATATIGADGSITGLDANMYAGALDQYVGRAASFIDSTAPNADIDSVFGRQAVIPLADEVLAGTLPYRVITRARAHTNLPDSLKNFFVLHRYNTRTDYALEMPSMTLRVPTHSLGGHSVYVDYEAATPEQRAALLGYAERNDAKLSLAAFDVRPVISIGDTVVRTDDYVDMGTDQLWTSAIVDPHGRGAFGNEPHEYAAGSKISFTPNLGGLTAEEFNAFVQPLPDTVNLPMAKGLHLAGLQYWYLSDLNGDLIAKGWGGSFLRLPSVGAFAAPLEVSYFFGLPRSGFHAGYSTDIKGDSLAVALSDARLRQLMLVQYGTQASLNESLTWDILLNGQPGYSLSAASALMRANELRIPIHTITRENAAAILPKLQLSAFAEGEIASAVNAGMIVITPERELADNKMAGVGYAVIDPVTGGGLWRVDGGLNGAINVGCIARAVSLKILCDSKMMKILTRRLARWGARLLAGMTAGMLLGPAALPAIALASAVLLTVEIIMTTIEVVMWLREVTSGIRELTADEMAELGISALNEAVCSYAPPCFGGPLVGAAMSGLGSLGDTVMGAFGAGAGAGGPSQGNPISPDRGVKFQTEVDYVGAGPFPLAFERHYNSFLPNGSPIGHKWANRYFSRIRLHPDARPDERPDAVLATRGDGGMFQFVYRNGAYVANSDLPEKLERLTTLFGSTSGWRYTTGLDEVELYDAAGRLIEVRNRAGLAHTLEYDSNGRLQSVTDDVGRALTFRHDPSTGQLVEMRDPQGRSYAYAYNDGSLVTVTYPGGASRRYHYEVPGRGSLLTGITDERGVRYVSWRYDYQGRAIESSKAGGVDTYRLAFGPQQTTVVDPYGTSSTYRFAQIQESMYLVSASQPCATCGGSAAKSFAYDANGYPTEARDFDGNITRFSFNARGLPTSVVRAVGTPDVQVASIEWHSVWRRPTRVTETAASTGQVVTTFTYNSRGLAETRTISADGRARTWRYTYTDRGRVKTVDGPRTDVEDIVTYAYDAAGNLSSETDPTGKVVRFTSYDANGRLLEKVDANGVTTRLEYDARDRLTRVEVVPAAAIHGEVTLHTYDDAGYLIGTRLPDGTGLSYGYDDAGRRISVHDTAGNQILYTLNAAGDRIREEVFDPQRTLATTLARTFDALGQLKSEHGADPASAAHYTYDNRGNELTEHAPLRAAASGRRYDALNRLVATIDPLQGEVAYRYDAQDNLREVRDARGLSTRYLYNGFNELESLLSQDTGKTDYRYDAAGNLVSKTDARQVTSTFQYDASNRVTAIVYPDEALRFTYDEAAGGAGARGRLTAVQDGSGHTRFVYDGLGRVIGKSQQLGDGTNIAGRKALGQAFADGRRVGVSLPSGAQVAYRYNADGRVREIHVNGQVIITDVDFFAFDTPRGWTTPAGRYQRRADLDGQVTGYGWPGRDVAVVLDAAGRVTAQGAWSYRYDDLDRLVGAERAGRSQTWRYDATGNRVEQADDGVATPFTIDAAANRLSAVGTAGRQYDAVGNTATANGNTYVYSGRNRLVEVRRGTAVVARYSYNVAGQRVCAAFGGGSCPSASSAGQGFRQYVYDDDGHLVGEYDSTGALLTEYVWMGDTPVAVLKPASAAQGGTVAGNAAVYYIYPDQLDAPHVIVNARGDSVWSWERAPFGETPADADPSGLGTFVIALRLPGQQFDDTTGHHYNYYRDYEPATGRYLQSDPLGVYGGFATYAYADASPVVETDEFGLFGKKGKGHSMNSRVTRNGQTVCEGSYTSGNMTEEQKKMSFPQGTLASHTEAKACAELACTVQPGDKIDFEGTRPPCSSCKGKMNKLKREKDVDLTYRWGDNSWTANGGRRRR